MNADFWHNLWNKNEIGFHNNNVNELFLKNFSQLELKENSRVFIPLCGKTVDIKWLLDNGYRVVGIELNENAVKELFDYLKLEARVKKIGSLTLYTAKNIDIFVGDFFELTKSILEKVDAIYDRGAIVALPSEMRKRYTSRLSILTDTAPQLIITYEYNQNLMDGPPFSVIESDLKNYYEDNYDIKLLEKIRPNGFIKLDMFETVFLLNKSNKKID